MKIAADSARGDQFLITEEGFLLLKRNEASSQLVHEGVLCNIETWRESSATAVNVITAGNMMIANGVVASC